MKFLHRLTITQASLIGIINVVGSLQIDDALPAQANQMLHHEIRIYIIIHHHLRHFQSVWNAVVEDYRHTICCQLLIHFYILAVAAEAHNQTIHHKLLHHLQVLQLPLRFLIALGNHHLLVLFVEHVLNTINHLRSIRSMHLRHDDTNGVRTPHLQVHRHRITLVAESFCLLNHHLARLLANVLVIRQRPGNGRNRDAERTGYILNCYMFHHDVFIKIRSSFKIVDANIQLFL